MKTVVCAFLAAAAGLLFGSRTGFATIGAAEWGLQTPGGHAISSSDPLKAKHGTCLHTRDKRTVFVSKIVWWQYYESVVVGENDTYYFVFDEAARRVYFLDSKRQFKRKLDELHLDEPKSKKMFPQDGWGLVWQYGLAKAGLKDPDLDPEARRTLTETLRSYQGAVYDDGAVVYVLHRGK